MMKHNDFQKGGMVSVWVGDFATDIELDDYLNLSRAFELDFGFQLNERDMPESVVKDAPVPIPDLVSGFSWSESYAAEVAKLAKAQGISNATTMLVFLNFEYRRSQGIPKGSAPLRFLGVVRLS